MQAIRACDCILVSVVCDVTSLHTLLTSYRCYTRSYLLSVLWIYRISACTGLLFQRGRRVCSMRRILPVVRARWSICTQKLQVYDPWLHWVGA